MIKLVGTVLIIGSNFVERTDYLLPRKNFDKTFKTRFPSSEEWMVDSFMRHHVFSIFKDGSKTKTGPSCDIFSDDFGVFQFAKYMHSFLNGDLCNRFGCKENCAVFTSSISY